MYFQFRKDACVRMDTLPEMIMYIGTYGDGIDNTIHLLKWNPTNASLKTIASIKGVKNPSFLSLNQQRNMLYAISEVEEGKVISFSVEEESSLLKQISRNKQAKNKEHSPGGARQQGNDFFKRSNDKQEKQGWKDLSQFLWEDLQSESNWEQSEKRSSDVDGERIGDIQIDHYEEKERLSKQPKNEQNKNLINQTSHQLCGNGPCYVMVDELDCYLFSINYGDGSLSVFTLLSDNTIGPLSDSVIYKTGSRPHAIVQIPQTSKFVVTDLGLNRIYLYSFYDGQLRLLYDLELDSFVGPRHLTVSTTFRKIYIANELKSTVTVLRYNEAITHLETVQEMNTLPPNLWELEVEERKKLASKGQDLQQENSFRPITNYGADIHLASKKAFLYVSNRGHNSISVFRVQEYGYLSYVGNVSTNGAWPRNFAICPNDQHLFIANEQTNNIVVMKINDDGIPEHIGMEYFISSPACVKVYEIEG